MRSELKVPTMEILNGTDGREYGYFAEVRLRSGRQKAKNGNTVVSTIDVTLAEHRGAVYFGI